MLCIVTFWQKVYFWPFDKKKYFELVTHVDTREYTMWNSFEMWTVLEFYTVFTASKFVMSGRALFSE